MPGIHLRRVVLCCGLAVLAGCGRQPSIYSVLLNYQRHDYPSVIEECTELIAQTPNDVQAHRYMILASKQLGSLAQRREDLARQVQGEPGSAIAHFALGYAMVQANEYEPGLAELEQALALDPQLEYGNYVTGWIHYNPRAEFYDEDKGQAAWDREVALNPGSLGALQVYRDLGTYHRERGNYESARQQFREFRDNAFSEGDRVAARDLLEQLKTEELAVVQMKQQADAEDADSDALVEYGKRLFDWHRAAQAIPYWERALDKEADNAVLQNFLGLAYMEARQNDRAIAAFARCADLDPNYAEPHFNLGTLFDTIGRSGEALGEFERYLELQPFSQQAELLRERVKQLRAAGVTGPGVTAG